MHRHIQMDYTPCNIGTIYHYPVPQLYLADLMRNAVPVEHCHHRFENSGTATILSQYHCCVDLFISIQITVCINIQHLHRIICGPGAFRIKPIIQFYGLPGVWSVIDGVIFMWPETTHGVIPDTGGVGRLFQMCGPGVASDLVLTGRPMDAAEALACGVVSRVVPRDDLDSTVREMAERIAAAPAVTIKMARRVISHLAEPEIRSSMAEELIAQTFINKSDDYAEFRASRAEDREPHYTGC